MNVIYQGETAETDAATVAEFLASRGVDAKKAIVEYRGEVYAPGEDLARLSLADGARLDVFRLTAGG